MARLLKILISAFVILLSAGVVRAQDEIDLAPWWAGQVAINDIANHSFLYYWKKRSEGDLKSRRDYDPALEEIADQDDELEKRLLREAGNVGGLRQQYEDMNREFEMRRKYGLVDSEGVRAHEAQMSQFTQDVLRTVENNQLRDGRLRLMAVVDKNKFARRIQRPVVLAGAIVATYYGAPFDWTATEGWRLTGYTNIPAQQGQLAVNSWLFNGSFDLTMQAPDSPNPQGMEHYRLSVSRGLPILSLSTGFTYGSSSNTLTASVSKPLTSHLVAVLDSVRPMQPDQPTGTPAQQTLRFLYGIAF